MSVRQKQTQHNTTSVSANEETCQTNHNTTDTTQHLSQPTWKPVHEAQVRLAQCNPHGNSDHSSDLKKIEKDWPGDIKYSSTGLKAPGYVEMTLLPLSRLGILSEWNFNIFSVNDLIDCS